MSDDDDNSSKSVDLFDTYEKFHCSEVKCAAADLKTHLEAIQHTEQRHSEFNLFMNFESLTVFKA